MATKKTESQLSIIEVEHGSIDFCILGTSPIILNRMSEKVLHELLLPKGRKSQAERAGSLKHDPYAEFCASPYTDPNPKGPTLLMHLATAIKGAIKGAALDCPGASKSQMGRLVRVDGERIALYGVPQLFMAVTRSADMKKTPDVRTRCIVAKWAMRVTVSFAKPILNEQIITNLLVMAGITQGTGDWRAEKGSGTYGSFEPVAEDNAEYKHILAHGGRAVQVAAMKSPTCYDAETEELYRWFREEAVARGKGDLIGAVAKKQKALA